MSNDLKNLNTAFMYAELPEDGLVPEWIHLVPTSKGEVVTNDDRGPYYVEDAEDLIADSFSEADRLQIDENHSEDLLSHLGSPSPARGWITEMEARPDGIWGRVSWNKSGRELVADRAYLAMSPVILHDDEKRIVRILRASLVNRPNFRGLATLNQEKDMSFMQKVAAKLGLDDGATEDQVLEALSKFTQKPKKSEQSEFLGKVGAALGLKGDDASDQEAVLNAVNAISGARAEHSEMLKVVKDLQSSLADTSKELNTLKETGRRDKAERFVDTEIKAGRVGVKPLRDHYIARHMKDAAAVEKEISALPKLGPDDTLLNDPVPDKDGNTALNSSQIAVANLMGLSVEKYAETVKSDRAKREAI